MANGYTVFLAAFLVLAPVAHAGDYYGDYGKPRTAQEIAAWKLRKERESKFSYDILSVLNEASHVTQDDQRKVLQSNDPEVKAQFAQLDEIRNNLVVTIGSVSKPGKINDPAQIKTIRNALIARVNELKNPGRPMGDTSRNYRGLEDKNKKVPVDLPKLKKLETDVINELLRSPALAVRNSEQPLAATGVEQVPDATISALNSQDSQI